MDARQAKRNSSEVLSAAQVETLETAGPSRQASEAATVSPEVAREDEERRVLARDKMNQNHTAWNEAYETAKLQHKQIASQNRG